jgi:hypothetical protein
MTGKDCWGQYPKALNKVAQINGARVRRVLWPPAKVSPLITRSMPLIPEQSVELKSPEGGSMARDEKREMSHPIPTSIFVNPGSAVRMGW